MERKVKRAVIVSCSTAAEGGRERRERERERERESVCVCWLHMSYLNAGQNEMRTDAKWGKHDAKAQRRHYSPPAHGAVCRLI